MEDLYVNPVVMLVIIPLGINLDTQSISHKLLSNDMTGKDMKVRIRNALTHWLTFFNGLESYKLNHLYPGSI